MKEHASPACITPGFIHIVDSLSTTGTQKIQKHAVYGAEIDPRRVTGVIDLRARKRRDHK